MPIAATLALALVATLGGCVHADTFVVHDAPGTSPYAAGTRADAEDLAACLALLQTQREAWNAGDLEAFADGYHRDESLVFASMDGVQLGFDAMLERYRQRYGDRAAMGTLTFDDLVLSPLGRDHVVGRGTWLLRRADDRPWGRFTLVFRRGAEGWRIQLDYTTLEGDALRDAADDDADDVDTGHDTDDD